MNYIKKLSLTLVLLFSVFAVYAGGIKNAKDLIAFAKAVKKEADLSQWRNEKGHVALEADIDMSKAKAFKGISGFKGTFDGNGFSFMNWKARTPLFIEIPEGATVKNVTIDASCSMEIKNKGVDEDWAMGYIAAVNRGIVEGCVNNAPIKFIGTFTEKNIYIGGLVGQNTFVIRDSKNNGIISTECDIDCPSNGKLICVGGIVGICGPKSLKMCTLYRCENSAPIKYVGDMPNAYIGGIAGSVNRFVIRFCTNKGNINALSTMGVDKMKGWTCVGGIAGRTYHHIFGCDNFGNIGVGGVRDTYAAGISTQVNREVVVADCNNYGHITSSCQAHSIIGGCFAICNTEVHYCNLTNYGNISYVNTANKNAYTGGIGGYQFSGSKLKRGSYFRNCYNYGKIENRAEVKKNAFAGGILGRIRGTEKAPITLYGCENHGVIESVAAAKGDLVGHMAFTYINEAKRLNNVATALKEAPADGNNLFGRVTDTEGNPIEGVVVTDGEYCVQTDATGAYAIKSHLSRARFVYISIPSGYKIPYHNSIPQFFKRIPRHAVCVNANFTLEKRDKPTDKYTVVMMGDPQIKGVKIDSAAYKLRTYIYPDVAELRDRKSETEGDFFVINLGDLIFNNLSTYDDYLDAIATSGVNMHHAMGNHDYEQTTMFESTLGTPVFEQYIAPTNYSFNIGKTHYVIINTISFARKRANEKYRLGLEYFIYKWLERDLSFVPTDHTIVICGHAQLFRNFNKKNQDGQKNVSYGRYSKLLAKYDKVYSWSGHYHYNFGYDYATSNNEFLQNITSVCVARTCGGLHCNRDLNNDGTPNGYMVVEVNNDNFEWYYKSIGKERDYQMHVYAPTRTGGELVKVNIWNWSKDYWSNPEWWENGVKVGEMTHKFEKDIAFLEDHAVQGPYLLPKGKDDKARPYNAHGMFHIKPSEGCRSGEVRVTDNFGVTYTQKVEW